MKKSIFTNLSIPGSVLLFSISCGGGSGSTESAALNLNQASQNQTQLKTGYFIDSPVEGLEYITENIQSVTDSLGKFYYQEGDQITFKVGDTELGTVSAGELITPTDLVGSGTSDEDPRVANRLRFLQSLDEDGNPDNGIKISEDIRKKCKKKVNFNQDVDQFSIDSDVQNLMRESNKTLVSKDEAVSHYQRSKDELDYNVTGFKHEDKLDDDKTATQIFTEMDTSSDNLISFDEFKTHHLARHENERMEHFNEMDVDQDGQITLAEIKLSKDDDDIIIESKQQERFNQVDTNSDGAITIDEHKAFSDTKVNERMNQIFSKMDANSDQNVTLAELEALHQLCKDHEDDKEDHFDEIDTDDNGLIDENEFTKNKPEGFSKIFTRLDKNSDSYLSLEEMRGIKPKRK